MPNGGSICCAACAYGRSPSRKCDIFGTPVTVFFLCRSFRMADQSHEEAADHWPILGRLAAGVVYEIENSYPSTGCDPEPRFHVVAIDARDK